MTFPVKFPATLGQASAGKARIARSAVFSKSQTGSKGKTDYGRKGNGGSKIVPPWGPILPWRKSTRSAGVESGGRRPAKPDPSLAPQTAGYPANKPSSWPVEPDFVNHTKVPSESNVNTQTIASRNANVEMAYHRAGYF